MGVRLLFARALSAVGIIGLVLLFGISCGSNNAVDGSKSVSIPFYHIVGSCFWDDDSDGVWDQDEDPIPNVIVAVVEEGSPPGGDFMLNGFGGDPPNCYAMDMTDSNGYFDIWVDGGKVSWPSEVYVAPMIYNGTHHWNPESVLIEDGPINFGVSEGFGFQPN